MVQNSRNIAKLKYNLPQRVSVKSPCHLDWLSKKMAILFYEKGNPEREFPIYYLTKLRISSYVEFSNSLSLLLNHMVKISSSIGVSLKHAYHCT